MELLVPDQAPATDGSFPIQPRKVRKWLAALPMVNMGEATHQFYDGLNQLNRLAIDPKQRLEIMELLRPTARTVLDNLHKHLVSRALPLPAKSRKILQLTQLLLAEMATGYKAALIDISSAPRQDKKALALCSHRALRYRGELVLTSAQLYVSPPPNTWLDIYRLYQSAQEYEITDKVIKDSEYRLIGKSTVADAFKQACLIAIAQPHQLGQGDAGKLATFFEQAAPLCKLSATPTPDKSGGAYVAHFSLDEPPMYRSITGLAHPVGLCAFVLEEVIAELSALSVAPPRAPGPARGDDRTLRADLARRVLSHWNKTTRRRFGRGQRHGEINVAIGLSQIYEAIRDDIDGPSPQPSTDSSEAELTLMATESAWPREQRHLTLSTYEPDPEKRKSADLWDLVARGTVISASYLETKKAEEDRTLSIVDPRGWQSWKVVNASAGGFCLRWVAEDSSRAHVGELIALREMEGTEYQWRVGVVRWMRCEDIQGLQVGIQLLSPRTVLATLESANARAGAENEAVECLMLPAVTRIQHPASLLAPAGTFRLGDELLVSLSGPRLHVSLTGVREETGSFVQFEFRNVDECETTETGEAGFGSVWSSL